MLRFLAFRIGLIPVVAFGVITILFMIFKSVPGDQAAIVAGATATQAEIEACAFDSASMHPCWSNMPNMLAGC